MKVTKHSENLYQLTQLGFINCYLVREDDGFTLIDAAMSGQGPKIIEIARGLGLPITRLLLTHAHADHVGSLDELHEALPDAQVGIGARDARFLSGDMSMDPGEPKTKLRGGYVVTKTKPTLLFNEGDRVGSLEVVATPGHTPGQVAYFDTRDRALIVGDAFQTMGGVAVCGTFVPLFPLVVMATWNKGLALASARKLLALQPSSLSVGHGRVLKQPQAEMERAIQVMERVVAKDKESQEA
ncbi:MBL fold metallo-hydrolase [Ktedonospora formicarum]|uniref:MBL fold metallo-hydrolase n=1 Tax=Ktedonospora formicarum TaxID=2778364 RepID=A0A8J3MVN9_9CHLR|nr:MBL fold metallo-hydrolase [Ktedonospora formicarum]GHO48131.1 MBL fold metallo-hydrolase [Ktedonospora formicarum]